MREDIRQLFCTLFLVILYIVSSYFVHCFQLLCTLFLVILYIVLQKKYLLCMLSIYQLASKLVSESLSIKRISAFFFLSSSSFHRSYFLSSCSTIIILSAPILKCRMTGWNCVKLEKQKKMQTMLVASSELFFQSSRKTRASALTTVSVKWEGLSSMNKYICQIKEIWMVLL